MQRIKLFQIIFVIYLVFPTAGKIQAQQSYVSVDNLKYQLDFNEQSATLLGLNENIETWNLIVPDYIEYNDVKYPVTAISTRAFFQSKYLKGTLKFGINLKSIGEHAFWQCHLLSGNLQIPDSVIEIGDSAFGGCNGLTGELKLGNSVVSIGNFAFSGCKFSESLTIPNSVTTIGNSAFMNCAFSGILTLGSSVSVIGYYAFYGCNFIGSLRIPDSVNKIGFSSFWGFTDELILGESLQEIGNEAFSGCGFRGDLKIPDSVTTIGNQAFSGTNLYRDGTGTLSIGNNVVSIGDMAFMNCAFTGDLTLPNSVKILGGLAFFQCDFNGRLILGNSIKEIPDRAFAYIPFTGSLVIPNSVEVIGKGAFCGTAFGTGMNGQLILGESLQTIERSAFSGCQFEGDLTIPKSVTYIGKSAFLLPQISNIICESTIPPSTEDPDPQTGNTRIFYEKSYQKILYVPQESVETYKVAADWEDFKYIVPIGGGVAEKIVLDKTALTLKVSEAVDLVATILPETTTDKTVAWESSNEAIATVDANGKVTAVSVGKAIITATAASGVTATCEVTVIETLAGEIIIDKEALGITGDNLEMRVGDVKAIKVTVTPETTTDKSVTYESSNPSVARVDEHGNVSALSLGTTTITITAISNPEVKTTINVTVIATPAGSITLNKTSVTLKTTDTVDLVATILPETTTDKSVTWKSSDEAIATVDVNGRVTAVAVGKATITATAASGIEATCTINVLETPAGEIIIDKDALSITGDNLEMKVGESKAIKVTVTPETATDKSVTYESSTPAVASVDENGNVTALSLGTTTIAITSKSNPEVKATINVTVVATPAGSITLDKTEVTLKVTETVDLVATILPETTTDKSVTWKSGDEAIATVNSDGKVTAVAVGKATITATAASGISAECEITVVETRAEAITLDCEDATIRVNETVQLCATITPEQTTDKTVVWKSSDENIATVDANGVVTGLYSGVVTITATAACGVSASCTVTVIPRETAPITVNRSDGLMIIKDGETAEMSVNVTGGYPEGLTFAWSNGDNPLGTANSLKVVGRSNGDKKSNEFYTVRVVDVCDGVTLLDQTYKFEVETWPLPASDVTIDTGSDSENLKIREGNLLELSAETPEGGYDANWNFDWYLNGTQISTKPEMRYVMTMTSGTEMATEEAVVTLTATNFGPDGTVWGEAVAEPVDVTVYRRPLTPKQLLRKGDGSTHTLVVMSQYSDDELARLSYELVYGYTDVIGEDHIVATTGKRYCRIDGQVFGNAACEKWCYSQWSYPDGSVVTSGKRYLDGRADEKFDASDFSGISRPQKTIDFSISDNWIRSNGKGINISIETMDETRVDVFTISGILVETVVIPANTFMSVDYTAGRFTPDFYIISITSAEQRVVKKIIIK